MTGWWVIGSVGEAAFFGALCLLGLLCLTIVIAWQVFSPETQVYRIGFGFWVMVTVCSSFFLIGGAGFIYRVMRVATSAEHRWVLAENSSGIPGKGLQSRMGVPPGLPGLQRFTDSPGTKLAFRLPGSQPDVMPLILRSLFALAWNGMTAILLAIAVTSLRSRVDWVMLLVLVFFIAVGYYAGRAFFRSLWRLTKIGPTTLEVDDLPLVAGQEYRLYLAQYGRMALRKLQITLVCEEQATYHHGTDLRTERQVVSSSLLLDQGRHRVDFGMPLELECDFMLPVDSMHSFQSDHNSIQWKFLVEGEANRWPSFCRSFPVVVYPAPARSLEKSSRPS